MSDFSQNLDFFDKSFFDPLIQFPNKSTSNVSLRSKPCEEDKYESQSEELESATGEETDSLKQTPSQVEKEGDDKKSEKKDQTPDSFRTSLWSEKESIKTRTVDSWDVPMGFVPWDDNDKPMERLLSYADMTLTEAEENGLLTDRIIAACSSYLSESPGNKCHILAKVLLNNKNLNDIRILGYHRFLQYVDLSWNNITDLTPLGCLPYLMYLDVSHNLLEEVLRFRSPLNLTYVNYSYNEVWQIDDLTDFWSLSYLDLSHNKISKIQGLHDLRYLRHLDLSHNKIERFENLNYLRITDLNLEYNLISRFEMEQDLGMKTLPHLTNIYLNNNLITTLEFLQGVHSLKKLELQSNNITDLVELSHLKFLKNLRHLDLSGNPVSELKPYRSLLLNFLQELKFLDQTEVDISERVAACKKQRFDVQLEAARAHARMMLLDQLNDTSLNLDILPSDQGPYPFVILVGPSASSKKYIVSLLGEKYPEKIHIGKIHTTRKVLDSEKNVLLYMNKEDFNEYIKDGKFLCVSENLGHLYGFSREELGKAVKEHKLCLTSMDMVAALTIHSYGIQPFLVLSILQSKESHIERLKITYGPIFSALGAAYIAQRQSADSHAHNVKRIEIILADLLNRVMEELNESGYLLSTGSESQCSDPEGVKPDFGGKTRTNTWLSISEKQDVSESEISTDFVCYQSQTNCFACTPSKCGYQTSAMTKDPEQKSVSSSSKTTRLSESEDSSSTERVDTSYSAIQLPPLKINTDLLDGSSFGENDPFVDWSMSFIDWSEVNLGSLQIEEAAEVLCEKYIENVMSTRDIYQNLHLENPGLFSLSLFTDDTNKAVKDVTKFLKEVWRSTPKREAVFDAENDLIYKAFVPRKLEQLKEMLRNDFLSADGDGTFKGINNVASLNSPSFICAEMRLKGYGDFAEKL